MPLFHCKSCHHEWEDSRCSGQGNECDWCGGDSYILEEKTPLEKLTADWERLGTKKFLEKFLPKDKENEVERDNSK